MEVSATDIRGTMASAPVAFIAPKRTGRSSSREGAPVSNAQIKQMVEQMQSQLDSMHISLQYSFYGAHGEKVAVQVINRETGQVVREIPAKEMQALQNKIGELVGMIFNDNA